MNDVELAARDPFAEALPDHLLEPPVERNAEQREHLRGAVDPEHLVREPVFEVEVGAQIDEGHALFGPDGAFDARLIQDLGDPLGVAELGDDQGSET
jgi:hypothetical protein